MSPDGLIAVSPRHSVRLAQEYHHLVLHPPGNDFVVRTLAHRKAGGLPLMAAELVIAGTESRKAYPLTEIYPLHFRKTYFPASLHGDPQVEFERQQRASELLPVPPPIGWSPLSFRSCFLPGKPYNRISPFGVDPEEANIQVALDLEIAAAAGLWHLLAQAHAHISTLHHAGFVHGDMELHNLIVCPSPLETHLIDFENARNQTDISEPSWNKARAADLRMVLREAVYLQCRLGQQQGPMADATHDSLDSLFNAPNRFRRAIQRQAGL
ncbi:MAG: Lipopolysaccharide kinase (Kdo/WaaP) family protein [Verrucomicrobia bacterium]|nr:MAG: Lipopolysaccharide kinase (Kdo/WaaP) family protein [Verrucomicrobiota bacterium]